MKTSDKVVTFSAIFISCLALVVSIMQTRIMQKQSHAAVWPRLENGQGFGPNHFEYSVKNDGVGPALVEDVYFTYKDTTFQKTYDMMLYFANLESESSESKITQLSFEYSNIFIGEVIAASETIEVFTAGDSNSVMLGKKYLLDTDIRIDYCSIYDECWSMQNDDVIDL